MATAVQHEQFNGSRYIIKRVIVSGADDLSETNIITAAEVEANISDKFAPDGSSFFYPKLVEASWNMVGFDNVELYYDDEGNNLVFHAMSGDNTLDARGIGGVSAEEVADEGSAAVDEDFVVHMIAKETAVENDEARADITLVFKLKPWRD